MTQIVVHELCWTRIYVDIVLVIAVVDVALLLAALVIVEIHKCENYCGFAANSLLAGGRYFWK